MSQRSLSRESRRPLRRPPFGWKRIGIHWNIATIFASVITLFGLAVIVIVLSLTGRALRNQYVKRASTIATNLGDSAVRPMAEKNALALQTLVDKYARPEGVAYTFVEDGNGKIISDSLETFAPEFQTTWSFNNDPAVSPGKS